jgi:hypothetical protein
MLGIGGGAGWQAARGAATPAPKMRGEDRNEAAVQLGVAGMNKEHASRVVQLLYTAAW